MCPHILTLTNIRTALRSWWENSGDVTRILLTIVADPLARHGAKMSDTITLCIRILLTTQVLHGKKIDHGGSGGVRGTRGSRWKRNIAELLSCSYQSRIDIFIAGLERWIQAPVKQWCSRKALKHGLISWQRRWQIVDPRSRFSTRDYGPIRGTDVAILE